MRDVGSRIEKWRRKIGLRQNELAERAGVDATVLNRVEQRKQLDPSASFVLRVSGALNRTVDELLTGRAPANPVTILAEPGVPADLVDATAREIVARVVPLLPAANGQSKQSGPSRKPRGTKRNARKA